MFISQMSKADFEEIKPFKIKTDVPSFTINLGDDSATGKEIALVNQNKGIDENEDNYFPGRKNKDRFRKRKKDAVLNANEGVDLNQALKKNGIHSKPLYKKTTQAEKKKRLRKEEEFINFFEADIDDLQLPPPLPVNDLSTLAQPKTLDDSLPSQSDRLQYNGSDNIRKSSTKGSSNRFNADNNNDRLTYTSYNDRPSDFYKKVQERDDPGFKSYYKQKRQQNNENDYYYKDRSFHAQFNQKMQQKTKFCGQSPNEKHLKLYQGTDADYYKNGEHNVKAQSAPNSQRQSQSMELVHSSLENNNPELAAILTILRIASEKKLRAKKGKKRAKEVSSNMDLVSLVKIALIDSDSDSDSDDPDCKHKHRAKKSKSENHKSKDKRKSSKKSKHYYLPSDDDISDSESDSASYCYSRTSLRKLETGKPRKSRRYISTSESEAESKTEISESEIEDKKLRNKRDKKKRLSRKHRIKSSESEDEEVFEEERRRTKGKIKRETRNNEELMEIFQKLNLDDASNHDIIVEEMESDDDKVSSFKRQMLLTYGNVNLSDEEGFGAMNMKAVPSLKVKNKRDPSDSNDEDFTDYELNKPKKANAKSRKFKAGFETLSHTEDFANYDKRTKKTEIRSKSKPNPRESKYEEFTDDEQENDEKPRSKTKSKSRSKPNLSDSDSESFTDYDGKRSRQPKSKFIPKSKPNSMESNSEDFETKKQRKLTSMPKPYPLDSDSENFTDYDEKRRVKVKSTFKSKASSESKSRPNPIGSDSNDFSEYEINKPEKSKTKAKRSKHASSEEFTSENPIKHKKLKAKPRTLVYHSDSGSDDSEGFSDYERRNGIDIKKWKSKSHITSREKFGSKLGSTNSRFNPLKSDSGY